MFDLTCGMYPCDNSEKLPKVPNALVNLEKQAQTLITKHINPRKERSGCSKHGPSKAISHYISPHGSHQSSLTRPIDKTE
jgi:hypothetical protein